MAKPWHRYEQNFINHPKFLVLSPGAICLWLEGKNYCDMHLTDGMIPRDALRTFRFNTRGRVDELLQTIDGYSGSLWESHPVGFKMHDYLSHNPCRDDVLSRIDRADGDRARRKANQKAWRERHRNRSVTDNASVTVTDNASDNETVTLSDKQKQIQKQIQKQPSKEQKVLGDARSKRPVFDGQRLTVFEWMLDDCMKTLGGHCDAFDLHEWFFAVDKLAVDHGLVIPKRDGGEWLQKQLVSEAQRRGIPLRMASDAPVAHDPEAEQRRQAEAALASLRAKQRSA